MTRWVVLTVLFLPVSASAQPPDVSLPQGLIQFGNNEMTIVSTVDDPPALRLGVRWFDGWGTSMGKLSFNRIRPDGVQDEIVLLQGKLDERYDPNALAGVVTLHLRTPPGGGDEGDMVPVVTFAHDQASFHVPVFAPNFGAGGSAMTGRFTHEGGGCYVTTYQNDGQQVTYYTQGTTDETQWVPYWATWAGLLRPLPWPTSC